MDAQPALRARARGGRRRARLDHPRLSSRGLPPRRPRGRRRRPPRPAGADRGPDPARLGRARRPLAGRDRRADARRDPGRAADRDPGVRARRATSSSRNASTTSCAASAASSAPKLAARCSRTSSSSSSTPRAPTRSSPTARRPGATPGDRRPRPPRPRARRRPRPRLLDPALARVDVHRPAPAGDRDPRPARGLAARRARGARGAPRPLPPPRAPRARLRDPGAEHQPLGHGRLRLRPRLRRVPLHRHRAPGPPRSHRASRPRPLGARGACGRRPTTARAAAGEMLRAWLDEQGSKPFFWFVNLVECHSPYLPPWPYDDLGPIDRLRAAEEARRHLTLSGIWKACAGGFDVAPAALERMRHLYARSVRLMDDWLARPARRARPARAARRDAGDRHLRPRRELRRGRAHGPRVLARPAPAAASRW